MRIHQEPRLIPVYWGSNGVIHGCSGGGIAATAMPTIKKSVAAFPPGWAFRRPSADANRHAIIASARASVQRRANGKGLSLSFGRFLAVRKRTIPTASDQGRAAAMSAYPRRIRNGVGDDAVINEAGSSNRNGNEAAITRRLARATMNRAAMSNSSPTPTARHNIATSPEHTNSDRHFSAWTVCLASITDMGAMGRVPRRTAAIRSDRDRGSPRRRRRWTSDR